VSNLDGRYRGFTLGYFQYGRFGDFDINLGGSFQNVKSGQVFLKYKICIIVNDDQSLLQLMVGYLCSI
jgi:hypothetical protein